MKRLHLLTLTLIVVSAASAAVSTAANAELAILPTPSAGSPITFTFQNTVGTKATLETVAGKKLTCTALTGTGQATSARLGTFHLILTGCKSNATLAKCTGLDTITPGEILVEAEVHLRHLLPASEGVAVVILLTEHIHFTCAGILFLVLGCLASMDGLTKSGGESVVEKLVSSVFGSFLQEKGQQKPLEIMTDDNSKDEVCMLTIQEETRAPEEAGVLGEGILEKFEQNGSAITALVHLK